MASPYPDGDREKVASKLPPALQQQLKIRCAELGLDIQDATTTAVTTWRSSDTTGEDVDTAGARSFSTWLPVGLYDEFKTTCAERNVSYIQGLARSIRSWLDDNPSPKQVGLPAARAASSSATRRAASARPRSPPGSPKPTPNPQASAPSASSTSWRASVRASLSG